MMDPELKREVILDNYMNASNRGCPKEEGYIAVNSNNSSCIDNIDLWVKIENDVIEDIKFDGEACAISTASSSIMTKELKGKTLKDAEDFINSFYTMIEDGTYEEETLNEACVFDTVYKQANRKTCATLPYKGIMDAIKIYRESSRR